MMNKECSDTTDEHAQWDVDEPMYPEIEDGEDEQDGIEKDEEVVPIVSPFFESPTFFFYM